MELKLTKGGTQTELDTLKWEYAIVRKSCQYTTQLTLLLIHKSYISITVRQSFVPAGRDNACHIYINKVPIASRIHILMRRYCI